MKRIWHPYWLWEDWKHGMWRKVAATERKEFLKNAIEFTGNAELYGEYMMRVVQTWIFSCEHNLTDSSTNKLAWIGHAASALAINCPEDITRQAWGQLTRQQQDDANRQAQNALDYWIANHEKQGSQLCLFVET